MKHLNSNMKSFCNCPICRIDQNNQNNDTSIFGYGVYNIYSNGGTPFKVIIGVSNKDKEYPYALTIVVNYPTDEQIKNDLIRLNDKNYALKDFCEKPVKDVFVGYSPPTPTTIFSGGYGKQYDGNTILINTKDLEYILIEYRIIKFEARSKIINFMSELGNSSVPYPTWIDDQNNVYSSLEERFMATKNCKDKKLVERVLINPGDYLNSNLDKKNLIGSTNLILK